MYERAVIIFSCVESKTFKSLPELRPLDNSLVFTEQSSQCPYKIISVETVSAAFNRWTETRLLLLLIIFYFILFFSAWASAMSTYDSYTPLSRICCVIWSFRQSPSSIGMMALQIKQLFLLVKLFEKSWDGSRGSAGKWRLRYVLNVQDTRHDLCMSPLVSCALKSKSVSPQYLSWQYYWKSSTLKAALDGLQYYFTLSCFISLSESLRAFAILRISLSPFHAHRMPPSGTFNVTFFDPHLNFPSFFPFALVLPLSTSQRLECFFSKH